MNIQSELQEMARKVATGSGEITIKDIVTIIDIVDFSKFKPDFLPPADLTDRSVKKSKQNGLKYVEKVWGINPERLMEIETGWLKKARDLAGSSKDDEKDKPEDLVTPQVLTRIISLAYFVYRIQIGEIKMPIDDSVYLIKEGVMGLNLFLGNPNLKGRLRKTTITVDGEVINAYNFLIDNGVHAGGYSKFLPLPEESLSYIFEMFTPESLVLAYS